MEASKFGIDNITRLSYGKISFLDAGKKALILPIGSNSYTTYCSLYSLSVPYDLTTVTLMSSKFVETPGVSDGETRMIMSDDGTQMYGLYILNQTIQKYILTTPYDLTTCTFSGNRVALPYHAPESGMFFINKEGTRLMTAKSDGWFVLYELSK